MCFDRSELGAFAEEMNMKSARFMLAAVVEETGLLVLSISLIKFSRMFIKYLTDKKLL